MTTEVLNTLLEFEWVNQNLIFTVFQERQGTYNFIFFLVAGERKFYIARKISGIPGSFLVSCSSDQQVEILTLLLTLKIRVTPAVHIVAYAIVGLLVFDRHGRLNSLPEPGSLNYFLCVHGSKKIELFHLIP